MFYVEEWFSKLVQVVFAHQHLIGDKIVDQGRDEPGIDDGLDRPPLLSSVTNDVALNVFPENIWLIHYSLKNSFFKPLYLNQTNKRPLTTSTILI